MADLSCKAQKCTYNRQERCSKEDIMVQGKHAMDREDTCCESFREEKGQSCCGSDQKKADPMTDIDCQAETCRYNDHKHCIAPHVDIQGKNATESSETACGSFQEAV